MYALRDGETCNPKTSTSLSIAYCGTCRRVRPSRGAPRVVDASLLVPLGGQRVDRATQLAPLGLQRVRVLDCLGGNDPRLAGYLAAPADRDIFAAFGDHVARLSQQCADASDPITISLIAAARFLCGDIAAANVILDHLPVEAFKPDHGAGICLVAPLYALSATLPLPAQLKDTNR